MERYFRLKPEVMVEKNGDTLAMYNLITKEFLLVEDEFAMMVLRAESNAPIKENELFDTLIEKKMGDYFTRQIYVDKLRKFNVFSRKKLQKDRPLLSTVIIHLTNKCSNACEYCGKVFCPPCTRRLTDKSDDRCASGWIRVIKDLIEYGARNFILTGGNVFEYSGLDEIIDFIATVPSVSVAINCTVVPDANTIKNGVSHNVLLHSKADIKTCSDFVALAPKNSVYFFTYEKDVYSEFHETLPIHLMRRDQPSLAVENFLPVDVDLYFDRKTYDVCLTSKMTILSNGDVVPCLGHVDDCLGNVFETSVPEIIKRLDMSYWKTGVNCREAYGACSSCVVRYACPRCRFSSELSDCFMKRRKSESRSN